MRDDTRLVGQAKRRLSLAYMAVMALLLLLLISAVYAGVSSVLRNNADQMLNERAIMISQALGLRVDATRLAARDVDGDLARRLTASEPHGIGDATDAVGRETDDAEGESERLDSALALEENPPALRTANAVLVDARGAVIASSPAVLQALDHASVQKALASGRGTYGTVGRETDAIRTLTIPVVSGETAVGALQVALSLRQVSGVEHALLLLLAALAVAGLAGAGVGGWWMAGRALVPLQAAMVRQRRFVSDASHELRTPLAVLRANAEMLETSLRQGATPSADDLESLDDLVAESERLSRLVNDLLTLTRADEGETILRLRQFDLVQLCSGVCRRAGALLERHGMEAHLLLPEELVVRGDPDRVEQLLWILLDNAIKYGHSGGQVEVSAEVRHAGHRHPARPFAQRERWVTLAVRDDGPGLAPDALAHVFDRFYRADSARYGEGHGLGLAIARAIAAAHGGRLTVESRLGEGSTFRFSWPA